MLFILSLLLSFAASAANFTVAASYPAPGSLAVPATSVSFQWLVDGAASGTAFNLSLTSTGTSKTFTLNDGQTVTLRITASNEHGSTVSEGSATAVVAGDPPSPMTINVTATQQ
jgi:heme/copper-type cytochrome/quinol oxidase subunit 2